MSDREQFEMHRIVRSHLDSFVRSWSLEAEDEATQFEKFANHAVISSRFSSSYDLDNVTTGPSEDGTDGIAVPSRGVWKFGGGVISG